MAARSTATLLGLGPSYHGSHRVADRICESAAEAVESSRSAGSIRTATAVVTTLGAAAVATTAFAGAASASTQPDYVHTWDRVAACESGDNWQINTGNGYYGGLQFSASTWSAYNGGKYASSANLATKMEQIAVARRVLHAQGPNAWPVCGPQGGLTMSTGAATGAPLPADPGPGNQGDHHERAHLRKLRNPHAHQHSHHATHHKSAHHGDHHGQHRSGSHRSDHMTHYTVRSGDTLSEIASSHHVHGGWHHLWQLNRHRVPNPNVLRVGQILLLPA